MSQSKLEEVVNKLYDGKVLIRFTPQNHAYWLLPLGGLKPMKRLTGVTTFIGVLDKSKALVPWAVDITIGFIKDHMELMKQEEVDPDEIYSLARAESNKQRDLAAEVGSAVHKWVEGHIKGEEPEMPSEPKVLKAVLAFIEWVEVNKVKFLWSERIVYSKKHGYVGTADMGLVIGAGPLKGKKLLGDMKVTNALYPPVRMQTAAYLSAILEESPKEKYDGRIAIRISKENEAEYTARMEEKWKRKGYAIPIPPFQIFEAKFLDEEESVERDFDGFVAAKDLFEWNKQTEKLMWGKN